MQTIIFVLLVIVVFIILLTIGFKRWKKSAIRVMDDGEVMVTAMGKIDPEELTKRTSLMG